MFYKRATGLFLTFIICYSIIIARMFSLSITQGETISITAQKQQQYLFTIADKRGTIYDCNGIPMTYLGKGYVALVQPSLIMDHDKSAKHLANLAKWTLEDMKKQLATNRPFAFPMEYFGKDETGVSVIEVYTRQKDEEAGHLLGSVNEKENKGISGLEAACNDLLSSKTELYVSTAVDGKRREIVGQGVSIFSQDYYGKNGIQLTVDARLQHILEEGAARFLTKGAAVVSNVKTGEILGLCSRPSYDAKFMGRYLSSENGELLNRALQSYNLGSIFKIIVAATAYETKTILPEKVLCNGSITIDGRTYQCHKETGHGWVDMEEAFQQSCNPYFIKQGMATGLNPILEMAERFGLNKPISLHENYSTKKTVMPAKYAGKKPSTALIANTSIGQGDILISPIHALQIINIVANGGVKEHMSVVSGTIEQGECVPFERQQGIEVISQEIADYVKHLMFLTMESGTGTGGKLEHYTGGGKTGSAETGQKIGEEDVTHGWFTGYFPADDPKYAIVVFAENGKSGAAAGAPYFKFIGDEMEKFGFLN